MPAVATNIHPTAIVDPSAQLGDGVTIGPGAIIGPGCIVGDGSRLQAGAILVENTTLGARNDVHAGAILGGDPQDRSFNRGDDVGSLIIGDQNVFREGVTLNRGVGSAGPTRIGHGNYFMACSHAGHNCIVGNGNNFANGSCLAGHVHVGDHCFISAHAGVHQFVTIGDLVMMRGIAGVSMHVPPFVVVRNINNVVCLNSVGLRRCKDFSSDELHELREAFGIVYRGRSARTLSRALEAAQARQWGRAAAQFFDFIQRMIAADPPRSRGICPARHMLKNT